MQTVRLEAYEAPAFTVSETELYIELDAHKTRIHARLELIRQHSLQVPLVLWGRDLELLDIRLDGQPLPEESWLQDDASLTLYQVPDEFTLDLVTCICPASNTSLEGLYQSGELLCTQCEPEGFRKLTYFLDRPDVLSRYRVTLVADRQRYPVLLANGNCIDAGRLDRNRHFAIWEDPFPKPCYLFALVAGPLSKLEKPYTTASGRHVDLQLFVESGNEDKGDFALQALQQAMRWDEQVFGLEYDLDCYMIVAVDTFNMGAMENKGLNIFNSKYVLATPETATDNDYLAIQEVVAHEYFHNWTGNRVTLRDWFQLSLKEGLTVFREQEYAAEIYSHVVKRIEDMAFLRQYQFSEDASPLAHPVQPQEYQQINNFYTATVYHKGAEVVRVFRHVLGWEGFLRGLRLFLQRCDGKAATVDDFIAALGTANEQDVHLLRRWYQCVGTLHVKANWQYDDQKQTLTLKLQQQLPTHPDGSSQPPLVVPVRLALLDEGGREQPLDAAGNTEQTLLLQDYQQTFVYRGLQRAVVPSLLRGFSAPVRLEASYSDAQLAFLFAWDTDACKRWDAGQELALRVLLARLEVAEEAPKVAKTFDLLQQAFGSCLEHAAEDFAWAAKALELPAEKELGEQAPQPWDPLELHAVHQQLQCQLAAHWQQPLQDWYQQLWTQEDDRFAAEAIGRRAFRNLCLAYLGLLPDSEAGALAWQQFSEARLLTDSLAALQVLARRGGEAATLALSEFRQRWQQHAQVMDKWYAVQAAVHSPDTFAQVQQLAGEEGFDPLNPNRMRALLGTWVKNAPAFHHADGAGYAYLAEQVLFLDGRNPQLAAALVKPLCRWARFAAPWSEGMRHALERVAGEAGSSDVGELVQRSLA